MVGVDRRARGIGTVLQQRLDRLGKASGLPVVLGGLTAETGAGRRLRISHGVGTLGRGLLGLEVTPRRGLGGTVVSRARPYRIEDYAHSTSITHDYDHVVVEQERIRSIFAFPVVVDGAVRGVIYGATREALPIGDAALKHAGDTAAAFAQDIEGLGAGRGPTDEQDTRPVRAEGALRELAALARSVTDPGLRDKLARIHADLGGPAWNGPSGGHETAVGMTPRELDVLRLVEVGASNTVIAAELGLTVPTVKAYLGSAMRRLQVRNRTSAVHVARSLDLL